MHAPEDYQEPPCTEVCDDRGFPDGWVERMGDKALIVEWAPQPTVLSHASIGLFISHCGWNSLTECITLAGVPIVGLPMLTDQPMNADIMEHKLHIGKNLWKCPAEGRIDHLTAATTIEQVMTNKELIHNAERLKRQNIERWLPSGSSIQQLRELIA
ncbi:hypothetical protein BGX20_004646 [Mortierella sp. AD010]|nr:hypothetical protein BGX20_004646 [Mortierella sp. AD010]